MFWLFIPYCLAVGTETHDKIRPVICNLLLWHVICHQKVKVWLFTWKCEGGVCGQGPPTKQNMVALGLWYKKRLELNFVCGILFIPLLSLSLRDVSGVELLMNNHQSLKAEIDAREDNFNVCVSLGKELLSRNHYASGEIKDKLMSLSNQRNNMLQRWEERWEHLQLSKWFWFMEYLSYWKKMFSKYRKKFFVYAKKYWTPIRWNLFLF